MNPLSFVDALQPVNWPTFALLSARVAGLMFAAPLWSLTSVPARIRGAMGVVLALALMPMATRADVVVDGMSVVVPMMIELLLGLVIGLSAAVMLYAVSVAAEVVSLQMGLSLGVALSGMGEVGAPGIGQLKGQFALVVFASLGGHVALVAALARSVATIPPGAPIDMAGGGTAIVWGMGAVFSTAIQVAAPVMVALLVTNLALAVINRAVPQLNTMMVAVPVTVAVGIIAIGATLPLLVDLFGAWAAGAGGVADAAVDGFRPVVR